MAHDHNYKLLSEHNLAAGTFAKANPLTGRPHCTYYWFGTVFTPSVHFYLNLRSFYYQ